MESPVSCVFPARSRTRPFGIKWRSSVGYATLVVGFGVATDLLVYAIIIPVVPFRLEELGYHSVSALTAWLLFAYSLGLVISTPIIAWLSEKYQARQPPLLWGLLALAGFIIMFMEAPNYPVMVLARFVQGISSSVIWVVGLALLCDTAPEHKIGQQLGLATTGLTIGMLAAPPIGGALYNRFGFRAPFVFGIIFAVIDFDGRLFVIERKDALKWGYDPAVATPQSIESVEGSPLGSEPKPIESLATGKEAKLLTEERNVQASTRSVEGQQHPKRLSEFEVLKFMIKSSRTIMALFSVFIYGISFTGLEPTMPLRLQDLYGFDSTKVGLIFLASAVPTIFSSPLSGWLSDRYGTEWVVVISLGASAPWFILLVIKTRLAFFITCVAISSFFLSSALPPLTAELASIVRTVEGVGYAHIYGAFNLAYGIGSTVGPLVSGQVYSHVPDGWTIFCSYAGAVLVIDAILSMFFTGERPLAHRLLRRHRETASGEEMS